MRIHTNKSFFLGFLGYFLTSSVLLLFSALKDLMQANDITLFFIHLVIVLLLAFFLSVLCSGLLAILRLFHPAFSVIQASFWLSVFIMVCFLLFAPLLRDIIYFIDGLDPNRTPPYADRTADGEFMLYDLSSRARYVIGISWLVLYVVLIFIVDFILKVKNRCERSKKPSPVQ